ncbi:MAG: outer membrane beta-barrel protein [Saprospiraceae bacterium]
MKSFIVSLLVALPFIAFSQPNSTVDLVGGADYAFRFLKNTTEDPATQVVMDVREQDEFGKLNFRAGFNYNRRLFGPLWLRTGLRWASVGYVVQDVDDLRWPSEFDPNTGAYTPDPNLPHELRLTREYWFIEVPLVARLETGKKKLKSFFEIGVSPHVYLTSRTKQVTDLETKQDFGTGDVNTLSLAGIVSIGFQYQAGKRTALFFQPIFRYHLTPLSDAPIRENLYNYGLEIGVRKGIGK